MMWETRTSKENCCKCDLL